MNENPTWFKGFPCSSEGYECKFTRRSKDMINIFQGYVRTKDKKPIQKFKDVDTLLSLEEASEFDEYAS